MALTRQWLQLTDLHLLADPAGALKGVTTRDAFRRVLADVCARHAQADLCLLTGDLAHDELPATYRALRGMLGDWLPRVWLAPGNHDSRAAIREVFFDVVSPAAEKGDDAPLWFSTDVDGWRLIGLDTHLPGQTAGMLGEAQLAWLAAELSAHSASPTSIFMHHPPVQVDTPWLDRIGLLDAEPFANVVANRPQLRFIATGHVHQELQRNVAGVPVFTTPSTSVQFAPGTEALVVDDRPPGYRVFDIQGDAWQTRVERVPEE